MLETIFAVVVIGTAAGWWVTASKFYPLYVAGHYSTTYNWLLGVLTALLAWETLMIVAIVILHSIWLATMLTIAWAIASIAWAAITLTASGKGTTTKHSTTPKAAKPAQSPQWTTRTAVPAYAHTTPAIQPALTPAANISYSHRSARVRRILAMGETAHVG